MKYNIYGAAIVNGKEYNDDELATLVGKGPFANWRYAGDAFFEECSFCLTYDDGRDFSFSGVDALNELLNKIQELK